MRKVMICTPMYNSQCTAQYTISMINLMTMIPYVKDLEVVTLFALNESLIHKTRNLLVHSFLKSDCTHLLFIDADIGFKPDQIIKMMQSDSDIVCGIYPKKKINWNYVYDAVSAGVPASELYSHALEYLYISEEETEDSDLIDIKRAGTGMMMISRKVFEQLADQVPVFKLESNLDNVFQTNEEISEFFFTSIDTKTKIYLHEDFNFCKLWINNGGQIYAASWVELTHSGTHTFGTT
jgi:hypothetical protein